MKVIETEFEGLLLVEVDVFRDDRGFFLETFQAERYREAGIADPFLQDNHSRSGKGVLRGLHFQVKRPQGQLVTIMRGRIFDVVVDLRPHASTFGRWFGIELSDSGHRQIYMAPGFAHGFCVLSEEADLHYKVTQYYDARDEGGLKWDDREIGVSWPLAEPRVSARDACFPEFRNLGSRQLPQIVKQ